MTGVSRRLDVLSLGTFVVLGLPDGMLGTAWPAVRSSLHAPVGYLGLILLAYTAGAVTITLAVSRLIQRTGVGLVLAAAAVVACGASAAFALAPVFAVLVVSGLVFGVAGGLMDGGLNIAVGLSGRGRLLNLLHAFYGVGTMVGPLVVTAALLAGSWRPAYVTLLVVDAVVAALWFAARSPGPAAPSPRVPSPDVTDRDRGNGPDPTPDPAPPSPLSWTAAVAGIAVFFVYTGLEVAAGQWEATYGRGHLHLSEAGAGLATFGYWAALTAARMVLGILARPPRHRTVLRTGTALAVVAAAAIWWEPVPAVALAGFVVLGVALAGVFPALVALTPARVGEAAAPRLIAWQVGAASAGGAALSALVGLLIEGSGLTVLGPSLTVLALILVAGEAALGRLTPSNTRSSAG